MEYHIEKTKQRCHEELDQVCFQYTCSHKEKILYFLKKDALKYTISAFVGLLCMIIIASLFQEKTTVCISFYFLFLGAFALYEQVKERLFHVEEILEVSYLNKGRRFLYKSLCLSLIQMMMFVVCFGIFNHQDFLKVLLTSLVPLYCAQVISFLFIKKIYFVYSCFIVYGLAYMGVLYACRYLLSFKYIWNVSPLFIMIGVWVLMMFGVMGIYKKEGMKELWN